MNEIVNLLISPLGTVFAAGTIIVILILMFIVSVRLYLTRNKKAYLSFTASLLVTIVQYSLFIALQLSTAIHTLTNQYIYQMLQIIAFLLINMGIYQLYNRSRRRDYAFFSGALGLSIVIFIVFFPLPWKITQASEQEQLLYFIGNDIYMLLLIFVCFYLLPPKIGQVIKYRVALFIFFLCHLAKLVNRYVANEQQMLFAMLESILPIVFYSILFLFLFDRVVEMLQAVYRSSIHDGLTGVFNRNFFLNRVIQYTARKIKVGVVFCDLDNFKKLNDTHGHQKGDEVLKQVAQIMREETEDIGITGRYGGEEFVMLITDSRINLRQLCDTVRKRIMEETATTISIGYSTFSGKQDGQMLIKQADEAMYHAKMTGKNKVVAFHELRRPQGKTLG